MKDLSWKHVALIGMFFGTIAILTITGHDAGSFIVVGMGVLGALGLVVVQTTQAKEQTTAVKEQTNGNTTKMLEMIESFAGQLAAAQPPVTAAPPESDAADWSPPKGNQ